MPDSFSLSLFEYPDAAKRFSQKCATCIESLEAAAATLASSKWFAQYYINWCEGYGFIEWDRNVIQYGTTTVVTRFSIAFPYNKVFPGALQDAYQIYCAFLTVFFAEHFYGTKCAQTYD
jgi:hypothetical protein